MALSTAAELKDTVQNWLDRTDYSAVADDVILLAEGYLNLTLKTRDMHAQVDITPVEGACALPDDFLGVISAVGLASPRIPLDQISPATADQKQDVQISGLPASYAIIGGFLQTYPKSTVDIELTYWQKLPSLTTNSTNWLLKRYPVLYLECCLMEAHRYFADPDAMAIAAARVQSMLDRMQSANIAEMLSNASTTIAGPTP